jgi:hypothetical protein
VSEDLKDALEDARRAIARVISLAGNEGEIPRVTREIVVVLAEHLAGDG